MHFVQRPILFVHVFQRLNPSYQPEGSLEKLEARLLLSMCVSQPCTGSLNLLVLL